MFLKRFCMMALHLHHGEEWVIKLWGRVARCPPFGILSFIPSQHFNALSRFSRPGFAVKVHMRPERFVFKKNTNCLIAI